MFYRWHNMKNTKQDNSKAIKNKPVKALRKRQRRDKAKRKQVYYQLTKSPS